MGSKAPSEGAYVAICWGLSGTSGGRLEIRSDSLDGSSTRKACCGRRENFGISTINGLGGMNRRIGSIGSGSTYCEQESPDESFNF